MTAPLVSVVMPVLNFDAYVGEAIDSVLAQTHDELELIVVDDGSTDRTRDIVAGYARREARVRPLYLDPDPSSTSSARAANAGIAASRGDFIARMDADDVALPNRLSVQLAYMQAHGLDVCGGQAIAFGAVDRPYWYPERADAIRIELIFRVGILHPTMIARAAQMRARPYALGVSHEDYEWQIRSAFECLMGNVPEVVLRHRVHPEQANKRHASLFGRDLRRYRFHHIFRLFPRITPQEYQILAGLAERALFETPAELEAAGRWLIRLADQPDMKLREFMLWRWHKVCDGAGIEERDELRSRIERAILPGAGA